jgi:hypothetical protein
MYYVKTRADNSQVRSMYNFVNCLQFNNGYEKVERPAPVGGALVLYLFTVNIYCSSLQMYA